MRHTFEEVAVKATKRWTGAGGKKKQRTRKFCQTINPFNVNPDGSSKTREQILVEITEERDKWLAKPGGDV